MNPYIQSLDAILYEGGILASDLELVVNYLGLYIPKKDLEFTLRRIFVGKDYTYESYKHSNLKPLSDWEMHVLDSLNITYNPKGLYANGLLRLATKNFQPVPLYEFMTHIHNTVREIQKDPESAKHKEFFLLREAIGKNYFYQASLMQEICTIETEETLYLLREMQSSWHKQLASLCLPADFLINLYDPAQFINTTAQHIGIWLYELTR